MELPFGRDLDLSSTALGENKSLHGRATQVPAARGDVYYSGWD